MDKKAQEKIWLPCGLDAPACDSVCRLEEWMRCADSGYKNVPEHIKDRIKKQEADIKHYED